MKNNTSKEAYFERLKNLAAVNKTSIKESKNRTLGTLIDYKRAADGVAYGIIKEQHHYYVKKAGLKQDPNVSDFAYIGGLGNITEHQYKSLAEADKQRNMMFHTINEATATKVNKTGSKKRLNEDKAEQEIGSAESKLGDLDAATAAEIPDETPVTDGGEEDMAAGLEAMPAAPEAAPEAGAEAPAPEGGEELPAEEPAPEGGEEAAPEGGEEMGGGDAAADLEASLGGEEGGDAEATGEEPAPEGDEEMGDAEATGEEPEGEAPEGEQEADEIQSRIGKVAQKIRNAELTDEQIKSYVGEFLSSFKDKFRDMDIDDRRKLANRYLLKVVSDKETEDLGQNVEDTEKAAGINQPEVGMAAEGQCAECGSFAKFAESMGYNSAEALMECGEEGVANLISNYGNHHMDGTNDGDPQGVATVIKVINPEMLGTLRNDYGHGEYADELEPIVNGLSECTQEEGVQKLQELFGGVTVAPETPAAQAPAPQADPASVAVQPPVQEEIKFGGAQTLGAGVVKPAGAPVTMAESKKKSSKSEVVTESEQKLRKYVRQRLAEKAGLKKPVLTESKKSATLKKLDSVIDKQFALYESAMKKKINEGEVNEIFGLGLKEKFASLDPNNAKEVTNLFIKAYRDILTNTQMGSIGRVARTTSIPERYELLKQYVEGNGGTLRLSPDGTTVIYQPDKFKASAMYNPFKQGGTGGKTQLGGV